MKMKYIIIIVVALLILLGITYFGSAMTIDFYYSDSCPYCREIKPLVEQDVEKYPYDFTFHNVQTPQGQQDFVEQGFSGVPAFVVTTDDCRVIKFTGADKNKLNCELQQMSTRDCPTISADHSVGGSWFVD